MIIALHCMALIWWDPSQPAIGSLQTVPAKITLDERMSVLEQLPAIPEKFIWG
jgi:hypothetical protein